MKVMKFSGSAISSPAKMLQVLNIIKLNNEPCIVVLSAIEELAKLLKETSDALMQNRRSNAKNIIKKIESFYRKFIDELLQNNQAKTKALSAISEYFSFLQFTLKLSYSEALHKDIEMQGELMSTLLLSSCITEAGKEHIVLPALDFIQTDKYNEPLIGNIKVKLTQLLDSHPGKKIFITQGSICRNIKGEADRLAHGGGDYTASSIAAAMSAHNCEIWSDIQPFQSNDQQPKSTGSFGKLSFDEAAELAYFGENILHPASIWPARHYSIPVLLLNTQEPDAGGILLVNNTEKTGAKVVAARNGIISINIKSSRMLLAYGFMQKMLEVFEKYHTPVDMITTSEVAVSLTLDKAEYVSQIAKELESFGVVTIREDQTIVTIVGNEIMQTPGLMALTFAAIENIPLQMVSYGGGRHNMSFLISSAYREQMLSALEEVLLKIKVTD